VPERVAARLAAQDSSYSVAHVRRRKVEINQGFGMVQPVMADLHRPQGAQDGNATDESVEAVAIHVRVPVRRFVSDEVQSNPQEERRGKSSAENRGEDGIVNRQKQRENVPGGDDFAERQRIGGLKPISVEGAMVHGMAGIRATAVHGEPVPDVFENVGVERAGEYEKERSNGDFARGRQRELHCQRGEVGTGSPSQGDEQRLGRWRAH
jgi:hypothetical protein